jgi:tRNA dimethylallyltransferase
MTIGPETFRDAWFLTGPTAAGKTAIGLELAGRLEAEIVSMDSMALYRRLDVGTAKPTRDERHRVPCHLIDVLDPWEECSLARYLELAAQACAQIRSRGRRILFVGGTPLYLKALLRGIFEGPGADWELRRRLQDEAERLGVTHLHDRLRRVDPVSAARIHPNDMRRVIRALEVYQLTGMPISDWQQQAWRGEEQSRSRGAEESKMGDRARTVFCLALPRPVLYERINRRTAQMFADGLVDEVRGLAAMKPRVSRAARQALGYKEVFEYLEGARSYEETIELVQRRTRRYAKHQLTWFRRIPECRCLALDGDALPEGVAETLVKCAAAAQGPVAAPSAGNPP